MNYYRGLKWTNQDYTGIYRNILDFTGYNRTMQDYAGLFRTMQNHLRAYLMFFFLLLLKPNRLCDRLTE